MARDRLLWWAAWAAYAVPFIVVAELEWFALTAQLYDELKQMQTLAAGMLAIAAAIIAYRGARQQAEAAVSVGRLGIEERKRAIAAAIYAELSHAQMSLGAQRKALRETRVTRCSMLPVKIVPSPAYDSDPLAIGVLSGDVAYAVTICYSLLGERNRTVQKLLSSGDAQFSVGYPFDLADQTERILNTINTALSGIGEYTGMASNTLAALRDIAGERLMS